MSTDDDLWSSFSRSGSSTVRFVVGARNRFCLEFNFSDSSVFFSVSSVARVDRWRRNASRFFHPFCRPCDGIVVRRKTLLSPGE